MDDNINEDANKIDARTELNKLSLKVHMDRFMLAGSSYERAILTLSTASLGFTFAFSKGLPVIHGMCMLAFTWFFLISSIMLILLTYIFDQINTSKRIDGLFSSILNGTTEPENLHWTECWMTVLPMISGVLFVFAIFVFTIFVGVNIYY